jgi:hypothetical protein
VVEASAPAVMATAIVRATGARARTRNLDIVPPWQLADLGETPGFADPPHDGGAF